ncbi:MAG: 4'-phosphopantetheinyl transferase family protein, partial [Rhodanobacter sp.]
FTITRVVLKHALSRVAPGTDPREIHLDADCRDKPLWKGQPIEFNVTHSGKQAYVAVSRFGRVGVDVEEQRADFDYEEVCATVFTGKELHALSEIPPSHRRRGFYDCWVRKEAVLKATGLGITQCLQDFSTVRGACDRWRIEVSECADSSTAAMLRSLSISMLDAGPKYSAAIAFDMQPKA